MLKKSFGKSLSHRARRSLNTKRSTKRSLPFLYKGDVDNVRLLGAPYGGHAQMSQIEGSDIWFHSFEVPDTTRLSYRIAPNVPQLLKDVNREQRKAVLATAAPDPLNLQPTFGADTGLFGSASTLTLSYASSDQVANRAKTT